MTTSILIALMAPLVFSSAAALPSGGPSADGVSITAIDQLPIEEAAGARCGVAFAVVGRWQRGSDPRGANYPNMETGGGREFFVRAMANLMEQHHLDRESLARLIVREVGLLDSAEGAAQVEAIMPACLLMKQSAGL